MEMGARKVETRRDQKERLGRRDKNCSRQHSPGAVDLERRKAFGFAVGEVMLDDAVDAGAAGSAAKAGAKFGQIAGCARGDNFDVALFGIAHPTAQIELAGLALNEPAEPDALNATLNEEVEDHSIEPRPVLQTCASTRKIRKGAAIRKGGTRWRRSTISRFPRAGCERIDGAAVLRRATLELTMVFVLDNYDSFTYNLVQYLGELGADVEVRRNDELTPEEVEALKPERILLSPGPCTPQEAGILVPLIRHMAGKAPILGVCLGHQAIGEAFGGRVVRAHTLMHGKTSSVEHDGKGVFSGLPTPLTCTRYHSLIVEQESLPAELEVTARTPEANGTGTVIMGLRHRSLPVEGVQFHPESVLTEGGHEMIRNFLEM